MLLGMLSTSLYRSYKGFGHARGINAALEGIGPWKSRMRGVLSEACLTFVSAGVCGRQRGICVEENGLCA